jgi:hypothetical protein
VLSEHPGAYPEQQVRVWLGQCQLASQQNLLDDVGELLATAENLIKETELVWWHPIIAYFQGQYHWQRGDNATAKTHFEVGKTAVVQGGSPDYLPLILLALARLTEGDEQIEYLLQTVEAAQARSRFVDRITCLQTAGRYLVESEDEKLREIGRACLAQAQP